jgi:hypothetical protein
MEVNTTKPRIIGDGIRPNEARNFLSNLYSHGIDTLSGIIESRPQPACLLGCKPIVPQRIYGQISTNPTPIIFHHSEIIRFDHSI